MIQKNLYYGMPRWLLWVIVIIAGTLSAQAESDRPVRILYLKSPAEAPQRAFVYLNETLLAETELPRSNFSKTFTIPQGDLQLNFLPEAIGENDRLLESSPSVKIPRQWEKVLLLVFEDQKNDTMPIRIERINASDNVFAPGTIYMINYSAISIEGTVGDKELDLKPQSRHMIKNPIRTNGFYPTKLTAKILLNDRPRRFIKQMWQHDSSVRQLLFIIPKPAPKYATYYCTPIRDF